MDRSLLEKKALAELREIASALELTGYARIKKADLIDMIMGANGSSAPASSEPAATDGDDSSDDADDAEDAEDRGATATSRQERRDDGGRGDRRDGGRDRDDARDAGRQRATERGGNDGDDGDDDGRRNKSRRRKKGGQQGSQQGEFDDAEVREGVLDLLPEGYGFLRTTGYLSGSKDVYVSQSFVRRFGLRRGDLVAGPIRHNRNNDKFPALGRIDTIDGMTVREHQQDARPEFEQLTPLFPDQRLGLETDDSPLTMRIVDVMAPIGKGQRGLIASPPKAGKTTILKQLARAIEVNHPEAHLMVLLVDERPEEVTDFERACDGEVISSTFDRPAEDHTQVAELCIERAKRLVERGRDVVILLDSITRLSRAYNLATPASGRVLSGGLDSTALYPPKRFFGAARNIEDGGSLTIIATANVDTGSQTDEVIFEEFKGTANMELRLDRNLESRAFPALDVRVSGTRREEMLLAADDVDTVRKLRRTLSQMDAGAAFELLIDKLRPTSSNSEFLERIAKSSIT